MKSYANEKMCTDIRIMSGVLTDRQVNLRSLHGTNRNKIGTLIELESFWSQESPNKKIHCNCDKSIATCLTLEHNNPSGKTIIPICSDTGNRLLGHTVNLSDTGRSTSILQHTHTCYCGKLRFSQFFYRSVLCARLTMQILKPSCDVIKLHSNLYKTPLLLHFH
jgi:hypothetical protein